MTTTAPDGPASASARLRASRGSAIGSTWLKYGSARAARSPAWSERSFERLRGDEGASEDGEGLEHQLRPLVGEDRADERRSRGPAAAAGGSRRRRGCGRRPRSRAARSPRRSSRPGSATSCAACGSTVAPRNASAAAAASARLLLPATTTLRGAVLAREPLPLRVAEHDGRSRLHDRELLGGDRLARVAEDVHVVERDVREHDDARPQDVRRVVAAAEPRLDDGDVDVARRRTRAAPRR